MTEPLRLVFHATVRLAERGVTEDDVRSALNHPIGNPSPGNRSGRLLYRGYAKGRVLVVVRSASDGVIITVYWEGQRA